MFHQGDLQSGIGLAVQQSKAVLCFIQGTSADAPLQQPLLCRPTNTSCLQMIRMPAHSGKKFSRTILYALSQSTTALSRSFITVVLCHRSPDHCTAPPGGLARGGLPTTYCPNTKYSGCTNYKVRDTHGHKSPEQLLTDPGMLNYKPTSKPDKQPPETSKPVSFRYLV